MQSRIIRRLKYTRNQADIYWRMISAEKRALPDFLIAGAQKGGTTSLYAYLAQHPNILPVYRNKEIHFWDNQKNYQKGMRWYRAHFPLRRELEAASALTGEKTPNYLEDPSHIRQISQDFPAIKMIVLLRNPVERAISNYFMVHRYGAEDLSLMQALQAEEGRLANQEERRRYGTLRAYKLRSMYAPSIKTMQEVFPPEQFLIVESSEFFTSPKTVLQKVCDLLGISFERMPEIRLFKNVGGYSRETVPFEVISYLTEIFRPCNEELFSLLGHAYDW